MSLRPRKRAASHDSEPRYAKRVRLDASHNLEQELKSADDARNVQVQLLEAGIKKNAAQLAEVAAEQRRASGLTPVQSDDDPHELSCCGLYETSELAASWNPMVGSLGMTLYTDERVRHQYARYVLLKEYRNLELALDSLKNGGSGEVPPVGETAELWEKARSTDPEGSEVTEKTAVPISGRTDTPASERFASLAAATNPILNFAQPLYQRRATDTTALETSGSSGYLDPDLASSSASSISNCKGIPSAALPQAIATAATPKSTCGKNVAALPVTNHIAPALATTHPFNPATVPVDQSHPSQENVVKRRNGTWVELKCPMCEGNGRSVGAQFRLLKNIKSFQQHLKSSHGIVPGGERLKRTYDGYAWAYAMTAVRVVDPLQLPAIPNIQSQGSGNGAVESWKQQLFDSQSWEQQPAGAFWDAMRATSRPLEQAEPVRLPDTGKRRRKGPQEKCRAKGKGE